MVIARKIAYNVLVNSLSKVCSTILALVSIGFITRYLGREGFGNYATVLAFLSFFAALADLGLYSISTREISREGAQESKIMGNIFSLRLFSSLAVFLLAPVIVIFFPYPEEVKKGIVIAAGSFIFSSGYQVLNGVFQKRLAMDRVAIAELTGKGAQVLVVIWAVKNQMSFNWIVSALLINMMVNFGLVYAWSRKYIRFKPEFDFSYWKKFLKESLPMGVVAVIALVYFKMDTILLSVMKSSADVGIYNAAYKVLENITFFPAMIIGLIFPVMVKNIFSHRHKFEDISDKTFKVFVILVVPLIVGVLFLADDIIHLIGGGGFVESAAVLRILVFALALIFFGHFFNNIIIAGNLQKKLVSILSLAAVFNITLNLMLIPRFSYLAAAYVSVATEFLVVAATFYLVWKKIDYVPKAENFFSILLAGVFMAIFMFIFKGNNFLALALAGSGIYFFFLWLLKAVRTSEITSLISKKGVESYEELP